MKNSDNFKPANRCAYINACYMAEELKCYGYKIDCPLYQVSNGEYCSEFMFHEAMDKLIDKIKAKYDANIQKVMKKRAERKTFQNNPE